MPTPTDGKITNFPPLPLPVQAGDVVYIVRNNTDYNIEAGDLYAYFNSTTTTTTTAAP